MYFEVIGKITDIQRIAVGVSIRELATLRKQFGVRTLEKAKGRCQGPPR
jgi:hypothetical protein